MCEISERSIRVLSRGYRAMVARDERYGPASIQQGDVPMGPRTVHMFVCEGFSDWEPSYVLPMLNDHAAGFRVRTVGVSRLPVMSAGGLTIVPDLQLADLEPTQSALLILPGRDGWARGYFGEAIEKARVFLAAEVPVAA